MIITLGDVAEFIMGQAPPGKTCNKDGIGVPFVKAGEFGNERPVIREWTTKPLRMAKASDVLVCVVGATSGKLNLGAECAIGRSVGAIRTDATKLDQAFLYRFLQTGVERLRMGAQGSAQGVITKQMLSDLEIPFPPLPEQRRIAAILDQADAIRRKRQKAIELTEKFLKSAFLEMFGDPVTNPKGWKRVTMSELFAIPPNYGTMNVPNDISGEFLDLRVANIQGDKLNLMSKKYVDIEPKLRERHEVLDGDILLARAIGSREHLGKCFVAHPGNEKWAFDSHLMRIRLDRDAVLPHYLQTYLSSSGGRHEFLRHTRRSAVQFNINTKEISKVEVMLPPLEAQQHFVDLLKRNWQTIANLKDSSRQIERLFNSLVQRAFRGELSPVEAA